MADVIDVAGYILSKEGYLSTMKLQKLVFYSQAYHLVNYDQPLFDNEIQAWVNGPVAPKLYFRHQGKPVIGIEDIGCGVYSNGTRLSASEIASIDYVLEKLGRLTGSELSKLTHSEKPWLDAREGLASDERSQNPISLEAIKKYYSSAVVGNPAFA